MDEPFYANPSFWVGAAFIVFIGLLAYYKVHRTILEALDLRAAKIKEEIDAAQRLRDEAQALLASYERKQRDALKEAAEMLEQARAQAGRDQEASRRKLDETIARREQLALDKIALAEAQAEKDVRNAAVEAAVAAAREVIAKNLAGDRAAVLVHAATRDLRRRLHCASASRCGEAAPPPRRSGSVFRLAPVVLGVAAHHPFDGRDQEQRREERRHRDEAERQPPDRIVRQLVAGQHDDDGEGGKPAEQERQQQPQSAAPGLGGLEHRLASNSRVRRIG